MPLTLYVICRMHVNLINPSTGRYFPLKCLFGTCLKNFLIDHSHAVLLLYLCQYVAKRWGDLKKNFFGNVAPTVIGLGWAKNGSKKGAWHRD